MIETDDSGPERVTCESWNGSEGSEVILYTVHGGGHSWPGSDALSEGQKPSPSLDATSKIAAFFKRHARHGAS